MGTIFEFQTGQIEFNSSGQGALDTSAPTFAGLTSVTPNDDGSFSLAHGVASGSKPPFEYVYYTALGNVNAATLFQASNRVIAIDNGATKKVFTLRDGTYFVKGQVYTLGVQAKDAFNYQETNTAIVTSTAIASGNLAAVYQTIATSIDESATSLESIVASIAGAGGLAMINEHEEMSSQIETNELTMTIELEQEIP